MKICRTCRRCFEDAQTVCDLPEHGRLSHARPGARLVADKYRLDRLLGRGGMGTVYAGTHVELERPVAVKMLLPDSVSDPQALERFRREGRAAARLNHPNVANTYDYGALDDGEAYLVMELLDGQTLREYLNAEGTIPVKWAVEIACQVAEGIGAAHHFEIVHRDLKPSNIILTRDHRGELQAKVVDFGIAKLREQTTTDGGGDPLTQTGALIGTPRYMSPEQCAGLDSDARSDVYSLAIILFEMLTGRPPFEAPSATAIALKHVRETPPDLLELRPDIPPALARLVSESLAKDPSGRPQTAGELAARLQDIGNGLAPDDSPISIPVVSSDEALPATSELLAAATKDSPLVFQTINSEGGGAPTELHDGDRHTDRAGEPTFDDPGPIAENDPTPAPDHAPSPDQATTRQSSHTSDTDTEREETVVSARPSSSDASGTARERRRFPVLPLLGALTVALLLGALFYALRSPTGATDETPHANTDGAQTSNQTPPAQSAQPAATPAPAAELSPSPTQATPTASVVPANESAALLSTVDGWLAAHNERNLDGLTNFYMPNVSAFYLAANTTRAAVRAEKARLFQESGMSIRRTSDPQITFADDGRVATMVFRKSYRRGAAAQPQDGEVLQEIVWQKTNRGWKITSERDLRVLR